LLFLKTIIKKEEVARLLATTIRRKAKEKKRQVKEYIELIY